GRPSSSSASPYSLLVPKLRPPPRSRAPAWERGSAKLRFAVRDVPHLRGSRASRKCVPKPELGNEERASLFAFQLKCQTKNWLRRWCDNTDRRPSSIPQSPYLTNEPAKVNFIFHLSTIRLAWY